MSVVIRLMRAGAKKRPFYRMVAADSRRQRDGRFLEILGHYNPLAPPVELVVHKDKVESWIQKGAQPSEQAASLLRSLGISTHAPKTGPRVVAAAPAAEVTAAKPKAKKAKPAVKRAAPRKQSERKAQKKVARKTATAKKKSVKKA